MQATKRHSIDGRRICVYDGLLTAADIRALTAAFEDGSFRRDEYARPETMVFRHWVLNISLDTAAQLPAYKPTLAASADVTGGGNYRIHRCYCNHAAYGDMLFTHTDCSPTDGDYTALWYIAPEWDVEWGGETLFYNSAMDAEVAVTPRPGRLVVFDGALTHVGRPPNRVCYAPRYTLAFKLEPVKQA
jgi:SM-20-related protein